MRSPSSQFSFHIETLGCPKNKVDSRRMRSALLQNGFRLSNEPQQADFLLINSCSFIREAQEETIATVFESLKLRDSKNKKMKVGLIGCFAERFSENVKTEIPELDFMVGTGKYHELPMILSQAYGIELNAHAALQAGDMSDSQNKLPYAWFRIAQGCSRHCAFCILPKIRGSLSPYDASSLERQWSEESRSPGSTPLREVILVSQDTISQGIDELRNIIEFFSKKDEVQWIRLQYLFPDRRVLKLLDLFQEFPKLVPYLDIPFQHVSQRMLEKMKRPSDTGLFKEILAKAVEVNPSTEIRTSLILGFPGEEQEDVETIRTFLTENTIHKLALFRYSHETGTYAGDHFTDDLSDDQKIERINDIRNLHLQLRQQHRSDLTGTIQELLVDEVAPGEIIARRPQDAPEIDEIVFLPFKKGIKPGDFVQASLDTPMEYDWMGSFADQITT
ncbi:MAG: MiaB/RimO family radical SAM methylthiotransferase [Leptospiraceae bacterium]|nr:MiaB/RimO family radical SAM methylthiotransferase [Leptospiraceae bacterium]